MQQIDLKVIGEYCVFSYFYIKILIHFDYIIQKTRSLQVHLLCNSFLSQYFIYLQLIL
jgi:hypothetical protein